MGSFSECSVNVEKKDRWNKISCNSKRICYLLQDEITQRHHNLVGTLRLRY
jgi:hypothetical protein